MSVVALLAIGIFGFRYMSNKPCKEVTILPEAVNSKLLENGDFITFTGTPVRFTSTATPSDESEWSFGDGTGKTLAGQTVVYTFTEPGQFVVELTVNDRCKEFKYVTVQKTQKLIDPDLIPHIIASAQEIDLGKEVVFTDSTKKATQWEWRFGETGAIDDVKQTAKYAFTTSGVKTVTLVINGNPDLNTTYKIFVKDKPLAPGQSAGALPNIGDAVKAKPETDPINLANRPPAITDQQFSAMLEEVVKGKQFATAFSVYLCDYLKLPIKYKVEGDKEKTVSFEEMCADLKGMRRVKKIITRLNIQESTGCIIDAWIKVDRRTF
jgi:hypothetical protein